MTKDDLKVLAGLPRMIRALEAFNAEQARLQEALARTGNAGPGVEVRKLGQRTRIPVTPAPPGPVVLDTPERREYLAARKAGLDVPADDEALTENQQRIRQRLAEIRQSPERQAKLEQFHHDESEEGAA